MFFYPKDYYQKSVKKGGHFGDGDMELRDRERELNNWLMEQLMEQVKL